MKKKSMTAVAPCSRSGPPQPSPPAEVAEEDSRQAHAAVEVARAGGERWQLSASASAVGRAAAAGGRVPLGVELPPPDAARHSR
jgi:hypothetical protein